MKETMKGRYGKYGGQYIPETLMAAVDELAAAFEAALKDDGFRHEFEYLSRTFSGRPTPVYRDDRLTEQAGGAEIWFKREDLCHTGAHKINNALGQVLLARRMGKQRIIAETGAGQHGVAVATVGGKFGLQCEVFMGVDDMARQAVNVYKMQLLAAAVRPGGGGSKRRQDEDGQGMRTHSVSAGLDYPGVGPEHAFLNDQHRAEYVSVTDEQALAAFHQTSRLEGIIPALESSHAIAHAMPLAAELAAKDIVLVNLSGRGDKDLDIVRGSSGG